MSYIFVLGNVDEALFYFYFPLCTKMTKEDKIKPLIWLFYAYPPCNMLEQNH